MNLDSIRRLTAQLALTSATVGLVLVVGAGETSAPEPANLGAPLPSTTGATAAAVYSYSKTPTRVLQWPTSYASNSLLAVGTPCSPAPLPYGATTTMTIRALNATAPMRKCQ